MLTRRTCTISSTQLLPSAHDSTFIMADQEDRFEPILPTRMQNCSRETKECTSKIDRLVDLVEYMEAISKRMRRDYERILGYLDHIHQNGNQNGGSLRRVVF